MFNKSNPLHVAFLLAAFFFFTAHCSLYSKELWVYAPANLLVPKEIDHVIALMDRAAPSGYTRFLIADSKFSRLHEMDERYFKNVERLQKHADSLGIQIVVAVCPVGYSNDILSQDPNLAEGLPVLAAPFVVNGNTANIQSDPSIELPTLREKKRWGFIDESFVLEGDSLRTTAPHAPNTRIMKKLKLTPFRQYRISLKIKTEQFNTPVEIKPLTPNGRTLNYTNLQVQPTQDWKTHTVTFNSLDNEEVNLYMGAWGPTQGTLWISEPVLDVCGAVNLVRRDTAPISVQATNKDGKPTELAEGVDFEKWEDPKLGRVPYGGEYETWHESPPIRLLRKFPDGTKLSVSYYHTHVVYEGQVCGAISDKRFEELLQKQIHQVTDLFPRSDLMMSHDEYRVMGWTPSNIVGLSKNISPGDLLTHNAQFCFDSIGRKSPKSQVFVWSDMFDPFHNAVDNYYLVKGSLKSAALPKDVRVMNWNFGKRQKSLNHFAELGHQQIIAGYYDGPVSQINSWLDTVTDNNITGVEGVMYTTWQRKYQDLESFAKTVRQHRWYSGK
jgi:hypothetical protein